MYEVVEKCSAPRDRNIRSDERIRLTGVQAQKDCPCLLRRLVVCGMRRTNGRSVLLINLAALDSQCGQVPSSACPH